MSEEPGRPTKYKPAYDEQATKLCLLGMTMAELAEFFEVHIDTLYEWMKVYPSFSEAIKDGKENADAEVAHKLYRRATGYSHPEEHVSNSGGEISVTTTTKHYPPDTAAAFIWLKNRKRLYWKDRHEHEHSGPDGAPIAVEEIGKEEAARRIAFLLAQAAEAKKG